MLYITSGVKGGWRGQISPVNDQRRDQAARLPHLCSPRRVADAAAAAVFASMFLIMEAIMFFCPALYATLYAFIQNMWLDRCRHKREYHEQRK